MKLIFCSFIVLITVMLMSPEETSGQRDVKDSATITSIIQEKKSRSPLEQKIDSRLLQVISQEQTKKPNMLNQFPQVNADSAGNIEVDISAEVTEDLLERIKKLGGKIIFPSKQYRTLRAVIHLSTLKTIAAYPEVKFIQPAALAQTNSAGGNMKAGNAVPTEKADSKPNTNTGRKQ